MRKIEIYLCYNDFRWHSLHNINLKWISFSLFMKMHCTEPIKFRSVYSRNRDWMQNLFKAFFLLLFHKLKWKRKNAF